MRSFVDNLGNADLQEGMASDNVDKPFEAIPPGLNDLIRKSVGEDLARERGNVDASRFFFQHIPKRIEFRVTAPHTRVLQFEGRDISLHDGRI